MRKVIFLMFILTSVTAFSNTKNIANNELVRKSYITPSNAVRASYNISYLGYYIKFSKPKTIEAIKRFQSENDKYVYFADGKNYTSNNSSLIDSSGKAVCRVTDLDKVSIQESYIIKSAFIRSGHINPIGILTLWIKGKTTGNEISIRCSKFSEEWFWADIIDSFKSSIEFSQDTSGTN